jgi:phage terminase small subunit
MTQLTKLQLAYVEGRAEGLNRTQAALAAGYSRAGANRQGSALDQLPHIKKAIADAKRARKKGAKTRDQVESLMGIPAGVGKPGRRGKDDEPRMKAKYANPLECLLDTMNNPRMPDSMRQRAAEQALPYCHGRIGEKGKKEKQADAANEVMSGKKTTRSRLTPKAPPPMRLVQGGKQ